MLGVAPAIKTAKMPHFAGSTMGVVPVGKCGVNPRGYRNGCNCGISANMGKCAIDEYGSGAGLPGELENER